MLQRLSLFSLSTTKVLKSICMMFEVSQIKNKLKTGTGDVSTHVSKQSLWFSSGLFPGQTAKFFYISTSMNWTDAQSYCRLHYTDLASVRSLQENEQIRTARPAGLTVWIGLYKDTWKWSNGNLFLFSYWASGEPQGGVENCTVANFRLSGQWEDWPCGLEKTFVCYHGETPSVVGLDQRTK
uniref:C-type lectin domain-containing protein n=1 Tax=Xiphophorus maculatus TaxID=8083 RepID=A0A3B5R6X6_XIPMA